MNDNIRVHQASISDNDAIAQIKTNDVSRRAFLTKLGQIMGGSAALVMGGSALSSALAYNIRPNSESIAGKLFTQPQMLTLKSIADTVLPKTDTPSASELDCHGFVDHQLKVCHPSYAQNNAKTFVDALNAHASKTANKAFHDLTSQQQTQMLVDIEEGKSPLTAQSEGFRLIKSLIVFGYFTSEVGATQVLNYVAVPGGFKGSVKVTKETKSPSAFDFY